MMADTHRQAMNLTEADRAICIAEAGLEWAIKKSSSTSSFPFGGGFFTVTMSGQVGDFAAESVSGTPTVELYVAQGQWTATGLYGRARRVIQEGGNVPRGNSQTITTDGAASAIAAGDLDADGDKDLVFGTTTGKLQVYLNDGLAAFTQQGSSPYSANSEVDSVGLADLDGDGDLDIVCADRGSSPYKLEVWKNNGSGIFTLDNTYSMGNKALSLALKDVKEDANGDVDVVVATEGNAFEVWTNGGTGTLTLGATNATNDGTAPNGIVLSDVDQDGDNDAMLATQGKRMEKWVNDGSGTFSYSSQKVLSQAALSIAAGELNGSAGDDMLVGMSGTKFQVYENNGSGTFTGKPLQDPVGDVYAVALYDMDGDGDLDAVLGETGTDGIEIFANDSAGTFTLQSSYPTAGPCKAVAAADFNYAQ